MKKNRLLLLPFLLGLVLVLYSWYTSYPLSMTSVNDSIFNHIPVWYWIGFPLLLASLFVMSITLRNVYLKWLMAVGCVLTLYSLSYFYYTLPGSDAHYFQGLSQYFINTHNLDASKLIHSYYQWPFFFILADITTSISSINYSTYTFLLYGIIGSLLATTVYVYASKLNKNLASLSVVTFFIVLFYFLNFQAVPFSLAFALFMVLFILQLRTQKEKPITILTLIFFTAICLTHFFVPLFFVFYLLVITLITKSKWHFRVFLVTVPIYLLVQLTLGRFYWEANISQIFNLHSEFDSIASRTLVSSQPLLLDQIAQIFSRGVTIGIAIISALGFLFILLNKSMRRKLTSESRALIVSGIAYTGIGIVLYTLGSRAIPLIFLPVSLGIVYLFSTRFRKLSIVLTLSLLVLFVFVPIHASFNSYPVTYQTKEAQTVDNFMIDRYNWNITGTIVSDNGAKWYISPQVPADVRIVSNLEVPLYNISDYRCVIYSIELARSIAENENSSFYDSIAYNYDVLYSSGSNFIGIEAQK